MYAGLYNKTRKKELHLTSVTPVGSGCMWMYKSC